MTVTQALALPITAPLALVTINTYWGDPIFWPLVMIVAWLCGWTAALRTVGI